LPHQQKTIGLEADLGGQAIADDPGQALAQAQEYVEQLQRHPADTDTREKLATLYAQHFHRIDMAVEQLEQLIALPVETPKHIVRWLNLLATLQARFANDVPAAEQALRRIIEHYPGSAAAEAAVERMASLKMEARANRASEIKSLGQYEKNIGLKPRRHPNDVPE
jgi:hypothetical protein